MTGKVLSNNRTRLASALVAAVLMTGACAAPGATTPSPPQSSSPPPASVAPSAPAPSSGPPQITTEPVTLVVEDVSAANRDAEIEQINKEFMEKYPNVTIERIKSAYNELTAKQALVMSGPNPPDVTEIVVVNDAFAKFGNQGLILPLDDYAAAYGWTDRFPASLLDQARFDASGQILSGPLYGIYLVEDVVALHYNKEMLAELGLEIPTTWEEFEASLESAKQAGEIPMMLGNLDGWPSGHVYAMAYNRYATTAEINGWTFHTAPVSWDSQPFLDATTQFESWATKGYFTPEFNAVSFDDATQRFANGEGLYYPAGTWATGAINDIAGDKVGLIIPPERADRPAPQIQGGQGQFWSLSGKSEHPDVGAAYLDFLTSQRAGEILIAGGKMPGFGMDSTPPIEPGLIQDLYDVIQTVNSTYEISTFEGTATPTNADLMSAWRQELLTGRMTSAEYIKNIQEDYENYWNP